MPQVGPITMWVNSTTRMPGERQGFRRGSFSGAERRVGVHEALAAGRPRASCRRSARRAGRPAAARARRSAASQVDAGAHAHGLEHEHQVLGDHVARGAGRDRGSRPGRRARRRRCARPRRRRPGSWPGPGRACCACGRRRSCRRSPRARAGTGAAPAPDWPCRWCRTGPHSSAPAATTCSAIQTTSSSATSPWIVQPKAVAMPASSPTSGACSSRSAAMLRTSSIICSRVLRTLASECARAGRHRHRQLVHAGVERGLRAAQVGHQRHHRQAGQGQRAWRTTSAASAICGSSCARHEGADLDLAQAGGVQRIDPRQLLRRWAWCVPTLCRPSRGPTSLMSTAGKESSDICNVPIDRTIFL